jgi:large subunit ribosomal protein L25
MADVLLTAQPRTEMGTRPAGRIRRTGLVPAVVYGLGSDTISVTVPTRELQNILTGAAGANTVITLKLDGGDQLALARQIQRHPVKGTLLHVDFVRIRADQTVTADVPISIEGEPEGVKNGGLLEQNLFSVSVEALPANLPNSIGYDVSALDIGDQVHVSDLAVPANVTIVTEAEELVVQVVQPRGLDLGEEEAAEGEGEGEGEGEAGEGGEGAEGGEAAAEGSGGDAS